MNSENFLSQLSNSFPDEARYEPILSAKGVCFSYTEKISALNEVDLSLQRGLVTMVLGRSGSGKTTLLRALAGIVRPKTGVIHCSFVMGENQKGRRVRLSYIPQTLGLVRRLSALENVLTGLSATLPSWSALIRYFPKKSVDQAKFYLESMGVGNKADELAYNLSGGERQRVAIARALISKPDLVLADEFVSQLDAITSRDILGMMRALAKNGTGFLVTTHDADIVEEYGDRLVVMRSGKIVFNSPVLGLTKEEILEKLA